MEARGSVVSLSFILLHPPEDKKTKKNITLTDSFAVEELSRSEETPRPKLAKPTTGWLECGSVELLYSRIVP